MLRSFVFISFIHSVQVVKSVLSVLWTRWGDCDGFGIGSKTWTLVVGEMIVYSQYLRKSGGGKWGCGAGNFKWPLNTYFALLAFVGVSNHLQSTIQLPRTLRQIGSMSCKCAALWLQREWSPWPRVGIVALDFRWPCVLPVWLARSNWG
jgi:hypothetical protein